MATTKGQSLAEFAASVPDPRKVKWVDTLPEDIRQQLLESEASANTKHLWLLSLGYAESTPQKVGNWLKDARGRRRQP